MATNRIAGAATLHLGTLKLPIKAGWTARVGQSEREGIVGQDGVHGYKEMPTVPFIEGTASKVKNLSVQELNSITAEVAVLEAADGTAYELRDAWVASAIEVNTEEGEFDLRIEGMDGQEITA